MPKRTYRKERALALLTEDVSRWHTALKSDSETTGREYVYYLLEYC